MRLKKFALVSALILCLHSASIFAISSDPHPMEDDIQVAMPCHSIMVFRKIYTGNRTNPACAFYDQPNAKNPCRIQGSFEDNEGFYFLLAKYELTEYQYQVLTSSKCPVHSKKLDLPAVSHSRDDYRKAASAYSAFLQKNENTPSQADVKAIASLPSECYWSFALRGGLKVKSEVLASKTSSGAFGSNNLRDYAWYQGSESASGRLQLPGRLKPNALGLYDMLGNAQEIMEDPYQGGTSGMSVRGGGFLTPKNEINNELRLERPLYLNGEPATNKDTATRFELGVPHFLSAQDVEQKKELDKKEAVLIARAENNSANTDPDRQTYQTSEVSRITNGSGYNHIKEKNSSEAAYTSKNELKNSLSANAAETIKVCLAHQGYNLIWSPNYKVRAYKINGDKLNQIIKQNRPNWKSNYNQKSNFLVVLWNNGGITSLKISGEISFKAEHKIKDQSGDTWKIKKGWKCN